MTYGKTCPARVHLKGLIVEMSTSGTTSRPVQLLRASLAGGAMEWRDVRCCSADVDEDSSLGRPLRCPFGGLIKVDKVTE